MGGALSFVRAGFQQITRSMQPSHSNVRLESVMNVHSLNCSFSGSNWRIVEALSLIGDQTVVPSRTVGDFLKPIIYEAQRKAGSDGSTVTEEPSSFLDFLVQEYGGMFGQII